MKELKPRDRFIGALRHEKIDRVPRLYWMKREAKEKVARVFGVTNAETGLKHAPELELRMGNDAIIYQIGINAEFSHRPIAIGETWFSHFQVGYGKSGLQGRNAEEHEAFKKTQEYWGPAKVVPENFPKVHPIQSMEQLKAYQWPDPNDPELLAPIKKICDEYQDDYFIMVDLSSTLIEAPYAHIMGTEKFFLMLFDEPDLIKGVLDGLTEYYTALGRNAINMGVDMIRVGDDVHPDRFIEAAIADKADLIGFSALLSTTVYYQKVTIEEIVKAGLRDKVKILIGGAPTTQEWADEIGADGWGRDAIMAVNLAKELVKAPREAWA